MKIKIKVLFLSLLFALSLGISPVQAQSNQLGIIPKVPDTFSNSATDCESFFKVGDVKNAMRGLERFKEYISKSADNKSDKRDEVLACAIKTGRVHFFMLPFFAVYGIEFLLGIAGLLSVLMITYGGFSYVTGALSQDKETGKKHIIQALQGLAIVLSAWIIVNLVQTVLTS